MPSMSTWLHKVIFLFCIAGFLWLMFKQWIQFFERQTSTGLSWKHDWRQMFPYVVICPNQPFNGEIYHGLDDPVYAMDRYDQLSNTITVEAYGAQGFLGETSVANVSRRIYTVYNGICTAFYFPNSLFFRTTVKFFVSAPDRAAQVFFLVNPSEVLGLIFQAFLYPTTSIRVFTDTIVDFRQSDFALISTEKKPCIVYDGMAQSGFPVCVLNYVSTVLREEASNGNTSVCMPFHLRSVLPGTDAIKDCEDATEIKQGLKLAGDLVHQSWFDCSMDCMLRSYEVFPHSVHPIEDLRGTTSPAGNDSGKGFYLFFKTTSPYTQSQIEYLIYSFTDIVSATGGALGMFLGWSVYQNSWDLISFVDKLMASLSSGTSKRAGKTEKRQRKKNLVVSSLPLAKDRAESTKPTYKLRTRTYSMSYDDCHQGHKPS